MTPHTHTTYTPGCYRCELSRDEATPPVEPTPTEPMTDVTGPEPLSDEQLTLLRATTVTDAIWTTGKSDVVARDLSARYLATIDARDQTIADLERATHLLEYDLKEILQRAIAAEQRALSAEEWAAGLVRSHVDVCAQRDRAEAVVEAARGFVLSVRPGDDPMCGGLALYDTLDRALAHFDQGAQ